MALLETVFRDQLLQIPENHLLKLQAIWRGTVVRKHFKALRHAYEQVFQDVQGEETSCKVVWSHPGLCQVQAVHVDVLRRQSKQSSMGRVRSDNQLKIANTPVKDRTEDSETQQCQPRNREADHVNGNQNKEAIGTYNEPGGIVSNANVNYVRECGRQSVKHQHAQPTAENEVTGMRGGSWSDCHVDTQGPIQYDKFEIENNCHQGETGKLHCTEAVKTERREDSAARLNEHSACSESLEAEQQHLLLELVWAQQAIASRKQYLRLKHHMGGGMETAK